MIRLRGLVASLDFCCGIFDMQVLRRTDYPERRFTNTLIGYRLEAEFSTLELTQNWRRRACHLFFPIAGRA